MPLAFLCQIKQTSDPRRSVWAPRLIRCKSAYSGADHAERPAFVLDNAVHPYLGHHQQDVIINVEMTAWASGESRIVPSVGRLVRRDSVAVLRARIFALTIEDFWRGLRLGVVILQMDAAERGENLT